MKKKIYSLLLIFCLCIITVMPAFAAGNDDELPIDPERQTFTTIDDSILVPEEELRVDVNLVTREYIEGTVTGDGVRLRAEPSTSGTVLELMYKGERVRIDNSVQTQLPYGWMRVQRIETGRWGYVSWDYINEDGID